MHMHIAMWFDDFCMNVRIKLNPDIIFDHLAFTSSNVWITKKKEEKITLITKRKSVLLLGNKDFLRNIIFDAST